LESASHGVTGSAEPASFVIVTRTGPIACRTASVPIETSSNGAKSSASHAV
jgi:hypothetical protein